MERHRKEKLVVSLCVRKKKENAYMHIRLEKKGPKSARLKGKRKKRKSRETWAKKKIVNKGKKRRQYADRRKGILVFALLGKKNRVSIKHHLFEGKREEKGGTIGGLFRRRVYFNN